MKLATLYKKTSTGAIQQWTISVWPEPNGEALIMTEYGQLSGKTQEARDFVSEGKNIGKKNETSAYEQAVLEATSQWEKKLKKSYHQSLEAAEAGEVDATYVQGGISPMLAHPFDKQGHKVKYPAFVQPKLDGHRCIAMVVEGKCTLWSRGRKRITGVPHIESAIEEMLNFDGTQNFVLDGELYSHSHRDNFEDLSSFIRSETPKPGHEVVQYWIYDVAVPGPFKDRKEVLDVFDELIIELGVSSLGVLATFEVESEEDMMEKFGVFLAEGYEGLMIRNADGLYINKRSYDLQKVKEMQDEEFEITDIISGRGKMADAAIFVCKTSDGNIFQCVMATSMDERERYLREKDQYIGKMLTVKFQNWSNDGVPRFPVGVRVREDI